MMHQYNYPITFGTKVELHERFCHHLILPRQTIDGTNEKNRRRFSFKRPNLYKLILGVLSKTDEIWCLKCRFGAS